MKLCYTYDSLSRVTKRVVKNFNDAVLNEESYSYDAAGNITDAPDSCFQYDTNNRLVVFNGNNVSYDMDGNMLSNGCTCFEYDSSNRLVKAGNHAYTYNAEDVRIRNLCSDADTTYTYDTNCRLSQLLEKTTNSVVTKYVYGMGLIGEECEGTFKTYHFDSRGSTVAITDINGVVTDAFTYDTYGNLVSRCGSSEVIFGYNGRDGVVTDKNGLIYMRARYYSPDMRRFVNADILHGAISDSTSLNRYSYVNGNPVSFVDPFGLSKDNERGVLAAQEQYRMLILKALNKSKEALYSHYMNYVSISNIQKEVDDTYLKIINGINSNSYPMGFYEGVKVRIEINPNFNTSGDELMGDIVGFIPVLGEISTIVDFASDEKKDFSKLIDAVGSAVTEEDVSKLLPFANILDNVGHVFDAIGVINTTETIINWQSKDKIATRINVYVDTNDIAYVYSAIVDSDLMFKECNSAATGTVIKPDENRYQIIVGYSGR